MVEQKSTYKEYFTIRIRQGQAENFENEYNENVVIIIKDESKVDKDFYYFYNYKDIKPYFHKEWYENEDGTKKYKYEVTKYELAKNNVFPFITLYDKY